MVGWGRRAAAFLWFGGPGRRAAAEHEGGGLLRRAAAGRWLVATPRSGGGVLGWSAAQRREGGLVVRREGGLASRREAGGRVWTRMSPMCTVPNVYDSEVTKK